VVKFLKVKEKPEATSSVVGWVKKFRGGANKAPGLGIMEILYRVILVSQMRETSQTGDICKGSCEVIRLPGRIKLPRGLRKEGV